MTANITGNTAADIEADPDRMRAGADRLATLVDELVSAAARIRDLEVGPGPLVDRCDDLVAALGRQVVDLALTAERTRRYADELTDHECRVTWTASLISRSLG
jgi:hypothetical protein